RLLIVDPIYVSSAAFFLFFFSRPLYDLIHDRFRWLTISVDEVMPRVMFATLIAVAFFYWGSLSRIGEGISGLLPRPSANYSDTVLLVCGVILLGLAIVSRLIWAQLSGGLHILSMRREDVVAPGINVPLFAQ